MRTFALVLALLAVGASVADAQDATDGSKYQWDNLVDLLDSKNGTTEIWQLVQSAGLVDTLDELTNSTATVFIPLDESLDATTGAGLDTAALAKILSYHVVPGEALTLDQLTDGLILQTLVDGPEGELRVSFPAGSKKPFLETTSGEKIQIYQYNIVAGDAIVHTIKGLLVPGTSTTFAPAPAPSA